MRKFPTSNRWGVPNTNYASRMSSGALHSNTAQNNISSLLY